MGLYPATALAVGDGLAAYSAGFLVFAIAAIGEVGEN